MLLKALPLSISIILMSGCSTTLVAYTPQATGPLEKVKYTQGVGTLSLKDVDQEVFMYPTFKAQGPVEPTFTIGYANNATAEENFSPDNIKAYFRGSPVAIYTYTDKIAAIRTEKLGQQVGLAILGGLAAGAAAYGASHSTYTSSYSGAAYGRGGSIRYAGSNTVSVYDPVQGMLVGGAVAAGTGLGIQQLEFNAANKEQVASGILQQNTVEPRQMVMGNVVLKDCCDKFGSADDVIRFDVTANGKVSTFLFKRTSSH
jgi:hypothetical protein